MNIFEKQFKDGTFLKVSYNVEIDDDGIHDLEIISSNLYDKAGTMIENTLSSIYILQLIVDDIESYQEAKANSYNEYY